MTSLIVGSNSRIQRNRRTCCAVYDLVNSGVEQQELQNFARVDGCV